MDLVNRINHHELFSKDSIHFDESMKFKTTAGRTVYGGGGIMPDIFIPVDTTKVSDFYNEVWDKNILYRYTLEFADNNRSKLDGVKSIEELDKVFAESDLMNDFLKYAERNGVSPTKEDLSKSQEVIITQIRSYIGRNALSDESGYYYNIYPIDDVMQRAVKELKNGGLKL